MCTLPVLRGGAIRDRSGAPGRRRSGDVGGNRVAVDNGRRRVVITGMGAFTPLGNDPESSGRTSSPEERCRADHAVRPNAATPVIVRLRGAGLRPDGLDGRERAPAKLDRFTQIVVAAARFRPTVTQGSISQPEAERIGASIAHRHRRPLELPGLPHDLINKGPDRCRAVLDSVDPAEHGRRAGSRSGSARAGRSRRNAPPAPHRTWRSAARSTTSASGGRT